MLSKAQRGEFDQSGYLRVRGAFDPEAARRMVAAVWDQLAAEARLRPDDPQTWLEGPVAGIAELKRTAQFAAIGTGQAPAVLDDLLGAGGWRVPSNWGQLLVTFPTRDRQWHFKPLWHTDYAYDTPPGRLVGVQVFSILSDLKPGGGGTLILQHSHQLLQAFVQVAPREALRKMKSARRALFDRYPWLVEISKPQSLTDPSGWIRDQRATLEGVSVQMREIIGAAGDMIFCHPWLLHSPAPNHLDRPRMMCTQRIHATKI
ncbi:MAG: phytanoyl-CoA dioxygenase family protein [Planctomycetota bacterium]